MATLRELKTSSRTESANTSIAGLPSIVPTSTATVKQVDNLASDISSIGKNSSSIANDIQGASEYADELRSADAYNQYIVGMDTIQKYYDDKQVNGSAMTVDDYKSKKEWQDNFLQDVTTNSIDKDDASNIIFKKNFYEPSVSHLAKQTSIDTANQFVEYKTKLVKDDQTTSNIQKQNRTVDNVMTSIKTQNLAGIQNASETTWSGVATSVLENFKGIDDDRVLQAVSDDKIDELLENYMGNYLKFDKDTVGKLSVEDLVTTDVKIDDAASIRMKSAFIARINKARKELGADGTVEDTVEYKFKIDAMNKTIKKGHLPTLEMSKWTNNYFNNSILGNDNFTQKEINAFRLQKLKQDKDIKDLITSNSLFYNELGEQVIPDAKTMRGLIANGSIGDSLLGANTPDTAYMTALKLQQDIHRSNLESNKITDVKSANVYYSLMTKYNDIMDINGQATTIFENNDKALTGELIDLPSDLDGISKMAQYINFKLTTESNPQDEAVLKDLYSRLTLILTDDNIDDKIKIKSGGQLLADYASGNIVKTNFSLVKKAVNNSIGDRISGITVNDSVIAKGTSSAFQSIANFSNMSSSEVTKMMDDKEVMDIGDYNILNTDTTIFLPEQITLSDARDWMEATLLFHNSGFDADGNFIILPNNVGESDVSIEALPDGLGDIKYNIIDNKTREVIAVMSNKNYEQSGKTLVTRYNKQFGDYKKRKKKLDAEIVKKRIEAWR